MYLQAYVHPYQDAKRPPRSSWRGRTGDTAEYHSLRRTGCDRPVTPPP